MLPRLAGRRIKIFTLHLQPRLAIVKQQEELTGRKRSFVYGSFIATLVSTGLNFACFTGQGLVGQPCERDDDCNPQVNTVDELLRCEQNICGYSPKCGDGIIDPDSEICDNGDNNVARAYGEGSGECSATQCRLLPYCGDAATDSPWESCDDGNNNDNDACPATCQKAICGDGFVGPGEACDPLGDANCNDDCARPNCGDGVVQGGEECDDGNIFSTDQCTHLCKIAICGDGFIQEGAEDCDDGNNLNDDICVGDCTNFECGDGFVGPGEACDDGDIDEISCTNSCALPSCGDATLQEGEQCDDGNDDDTDKCISTCLNATCGDSFVGPGEQCDDANQVDSDACIACKDATCGDGVVYVGVEMCDDGNLINTDACVGECALATCGDWLTQVGVEQCDDGNQVNGDGCSSTCEHEECGNGIKQEGEACDDGNVEDGDGCSAVCAFETCGDGIKQGDEDCDDKNDINTDACVGCINATCHDGVTWNGHEECDDGDFDDDDSCVDDCKVASCGDGHVWVGAEECDDGDGNANTEACKVDCTHNICGDGFQGPGEECDDGNDVDADPCKNDCTENFCGDGIVDSTTEGCDDGNFDDDDGCSNDCWLGPTALSSTSGGSHVCAIRQGKARCWGYNSRGQLWQGSGASLGDETNELPDLIPDVPAGGTVVQIVGGWNHTCALLDTGNVRCWGANDRGQLGFGEAGPNNYGDNPGEEPPLAKIGGTVAAISAGGSHTCALLTTGAVRCWGSNSYGALGQPGTVSGKTPEAMGDIDIGPGADVIQVAAGGRHTCVVLADGAVRCWGRNASGQLGLSHTMSIGDNETPGTPPPVNVGGEVAEVALGFLHTCARLVSGSVRCWGNNFSAQLGVPGGDVGDNEHPASVGDANMVLPGEKTMRIFAGRHRTCALLTSGDLRCWGRALEGGNGYGSTKSYGKGAPPGFINVDNNDLTIRDVTLGGDYTCALLSGGHLRCWGLNSKGSLGINSTLTIGDEPGEMPPMDSLIYPNP